MRPGWGSASRFLRPASPSPPGFCPPQVPPACLDTTPPPPQVRKLKGLETTTTPKPEHPLARPGAVRWDTRTRHTAWKFAPPLPLPRPGEAARCRADGRGKEKALCGGG